MGVLFIIIALATGIILYGVIKTLRQGDSRSCGSDSTHWHHQHSGCSDERHDNSSCGCDSCDSSSGCDGGGGE